jgi:endogenous inhibitor of DNA gyrase (YacG/DUF329 family)
MIRPLTCPVCQRQLPSEIDGNSSLFPFCSIRCKQVDLYRWMRGDYALIEPLRPDQLEEKISEALDDDPSAPQF